jgi:hypothetical protein
MTMSIFSLTEARLSTEAYLDFLETGCWFTVGTKPGAVLVGPADSLDVARRICSYDYFAPLNADQVSALKEYPNLGIAVQAYIETLSGDPEEVGVVMLYGPAT